MLTHGVALRGHPVVPFPFAPPTKFLEDLPLQNLNPFGLSARARAFFDERPRPLGLSIAATAQILQWSGIDKYNL